MQHLNKHADVLTLLTIKRLRVFLFHQKENKNSL